MANETLTVATANAHENRLLLHSEGLRPFQEHGVDILLLQEVLGMEEEAVVARLDQDDYEIVYSSVDAGLGIAVSKNTSLNIEVAETDDTTLHRPSKVEGLLKRVGPKDSQRLRERSVIGVNLLVNETPMTVASTHPIVFIRALSRRRQVHALGGALQTNFYKTDRLIVAGDMNHYPGPRKIDIQTQRISELERVSLDNPTWKIEGSRHEWMARIGSFVTRRSLDSFDAELDAVLYKGVELISTSVIDIESDHKAIVAKFQL